MKHEDRTSGSLVDVVKARVEHIHVVRLERVLRRDLGATEVWVKLDPPAPMQILAS